MPDFEIKDRDLAARIGRLKTDHGVIETPTMFPVINPNKLTIAPEELNKYGASALITNAYILWKDHREDVLDKGIHDFLKYDSPIMTDSGAYQLMEYGDIDVSNAEIIEFQQRIGVDIGTILDIPTASPEEADVEQSVQQTIERAREAQPLIKDSQVMWCGPIQGGRFQKHLKKSCQALAAMDFDIHPLGSAVPLLIRYEYEPYVRIITTAKQMLPADRPIHLFGAGHPMFFSFAVALGVDLFDSAAYALYAKDNRYITATSTERLAELDYFPCSCPVCTSMTPKELRQDAEKERLLAEHNLYTTFAELRTIKQAIKEKTLWELLERRARAHPRLLKCMKTLAKNTAFLSKYDQITKKHFFYLSKFSEKRPDIVAAKERLKKVGGASTKLPVFGNVPRALMDCYPFSQSIFPEPFEAKADKDPEKKVRAASIYWYGVDVFPEKIRVSKSPHTGRIRGVYSGNKLLAAVRASDFMILLHGAARRLHELTEMPEHRVIVDSDPEVQEFVRKGRSVFSKFVVDAGNIVPRQQVLIVTPDDSLIACGEALLNKKEMMDFRRGPAVKTRVTF